MQGKQGLGDPAPDNSSHTSPKESRTSPKKASGSLESIQGESPQQQRRSAEAPVYNLAKLTGNSVHGKRRANGDDVRPKPKRLRIEESVDEKGKHSSVPQTKLPLASQWNLPARKSVRLTGNQDPNHGRRERAEVNYNLKELSRLTHKLKKLRGTTKLKGEILTGERLRNWSRSQKAMSTDSVKLKKSGKQSLKRLNARTIRTASPPNAPENDAWETDDSESTNARKISKEVVDYLTPILRKGGVTKPSEALRYWKYEGFFNLPKKRNIAYPPGGFWTLSASAATKRADIAALLIQVTGSVASTCCTYKNNEKIQKCDNRGGPFVGCVIPAAHHRENLSYYGCANCVYRGKQYQCSLSTGHGPKAGPAALEPLTSHRTATARSDTEKTAAVIAGSAATKDNRKSPAKDTAMPSVQHGAGQLGGRVTRSNLESSQSEETYQMTPTATTTATGASRLTRSRLQSQQEGSSEPAPAAAKTRIAPSKRTRWSSQAQEGEPGQNADEVATAKETSAPLREILQMETWERAPGRVRSQASEKPESKCPFILPLRQMGPVN